MSNNNTQAGAISGVVVDNMLRQMVKNGGIAANCPIGDNQFQPASLDLRLGSFAYRLRASFLPGLGKSVRNVLESSDLVLHKVNLSDGAVLEIGCVYLAPLMENLELPENYTNINIPILKLF